MQLQEIDVFVRPDGTVKLEVRGVPGTQCLDLTADLEKLLGGQILTREKTPDYDQAAEQTVSDKASISSN